MQNCVWYGQTPDQVLDSLGRPHHVDRQNVSDRPREVWHYQGGHKRLPRRVDLEDGFVVGWE